MSLLVNWLTITFSDVHGQRDLLTVTRNIAWNIVALVGGNGLMLLYRPRDISNACALSRYLRYDLTYGMGMSDTITLVLRTIFDMDYKCVVDIVAETDDTILLVVVRYPDPMGLSCEANSEAITVLKKNQCYRLCDYIHDRNSERSVFPVTGRLRFRFMSNSSVDTDMNAYLYQVTVTAARLRPGKLCYKRNETNCKVRDKHYCFTSGVVCDGIENCGIDDWFDERKSLCGLPVEKLGYAPVIAVAAALLCAVLAASHVLLRCLPPQATSFFIFNANEDNRFCIDPVMKPRVSIRPQVERPRNTSLIPVFSSSSSGSENEDNEKNSDTADVFKTFESLPVSSRYTETPKRKMTMRSMTAKIQEKFRSITGSRRFSSPLHLDSLDVKKMDV